MVTVLPSLKINKKEKKVVKKIFSDYFESTYLRVLVCILTLKEQQIWNEAECNHAWGGKGKFWVLCRVVERFLFRKGKTSVGNIRNPLLTVSVDSRISALRCCRDGEDEKGQSQWLLLKHSLRPQPMRVSWTARCFSCVRHKPALAPRATCDKGMWRTLDFLKWGMWQNIEEVMQICVNRSTYFSVQTATGITKTYHGFSTWNQHRRAALS